MGICCSIKLKPKPEHEDSASYQTDTLSQDLATLNEHEPGWFGYPAEDDIDTLKGSDSMSSFGSNPGDAKEKLEDSESAYNADISTTI